MHISCSHNVMVNLLYLIHLGKRERLIYIYYVVTDYFESMELEQ